MSPLDGEERYLMGAYKTGQILQLVIPCIRCMNGGMPFGWFAQPSRWGSGGGGGRWGQLPPPWNYFVPSRKHEVYQRSQRQRKVLADPRDGPGPTAYQWVKRYVRSGMVLRASGSAATASSCDPESLGTCKYYIRERKKKPPER